MDLLREVANIRNVFIVYERMYFVFSFLFAAGTMILIANRMIQNVVAAALRAEIFQELSSMFYWLYFMIPVKIII
jgi:hypothetical protein